MRTSLMFLTFIGTCHSFWNIKRKFEGDLTPMDPNLCTGQDVTFTCTLLIEPQYNHSIGFAVKNQSTGRKYVAVDQAEVTIFNETVAQYNIFNISTNYTHVICYYWRVYGKRNRELQLGKTSSAAIYPSPQVVKDFRCIVSNYDSMKCSWDLGKDYGKYLPEIFFQWRRGSYSLAWNVCPSNGSVNSGYCSWTSIFDGYFEDGNITILLTLKQRCGVNVSSEFLVDTQKNVKPDPAVGLTALTINSTCIELTWNSSYTQRHNPKEHRVIIYRKDSKVMEDRFTTTRNVYSHRRTFCGLQPYTEYKFSVSMQPTGYYSGYFSDGRDSVAKTFSDIPSASPDLTDGGYRWKWSDCQGGRQRRVCVFWKEITDEAKNGPMKGTVGIFTPRNSSERVIYEHWAEDVTYGCTIISCTANYVFQIQARNVNGTSKNYSTIEIGSLNPGEVRPSVLVESSNRSDVYITWVYPETSSTRGFTVVWCRNKNGDCDGKAYVNWSVYPPNTSEAVIGIRSSNSAHDFLYGVSVLSRDVSGGLDWEDCVYLKHAYPKRSPQNVIVTEGPGDNTLVVTWDKLTCKSDEPYIERYNIQYENMKNGNLKYIDVLSIAEARQMLMDLEDGDLYEVTVRGVTKDGLYGPESEPQIGTPVDRRLKSSAIAGITMAMLVCVVFAGLGCFCVIRMCKMRAKMVIKEAGNITIPDDGSLETIGSLKRQESIDSGCNMTVTHDTGQFSDSGIARSEEYNFVYDWKKSKGSMTEGLCKLDAIFDRQKAEKTNKQNEEESVKLLSNSIKKLRGISEIPKPSSFRNNSDSDLSSEECEINVKSDSSKCDNYISTKEVVVMETGELSNDKVTGQQALCIPSDKQNHTNILTSGNCYIPLPKYLEAEPNYNVTAFHTDEQNDIISRDIQMPMETCKLLTHIPTPQDISRNMQSGSIQLNGTTCNTDDTTDNEPNSVFPVLSEADSRLKTYTKARSLDNFTTSDSYTAHLPTSPISINIPGVNSVSTTPEFPHSNHSITQHRTPQLSQMADDMAGDTGHLPSGNNTLEVPICSNTIQQNVIPVLQMKALFNNTATANQNYRSLKSIASSNIAPSHYVLSTNSVKTNNQKASSNPFHLNTDEDNSDKRSVPSSVIYCVGHDTTERSTEMIDTKGQTSSTNYKNRNLPFGTAEKHVEFNAVGSYVSHCDVETSCAKVERSNLLPVGRQPTKQFQYITNGPYVPFTATYLRNTHNLGYVENTFASVKPMNDIAIALDENTCNSFKTGTGGYIDQSDLENVLKQPLPQSCYVGTSLKDILPDQSPPPTISPESDHHSVSPACDNIENIEYQTRAITGDGYVFHSSVR